MPRVLVLAVLVALALTIGALVECVQTRTPRVLPRWLWAVVILLVPVLGPVAWFVFGRARSRETPGRIARRGPVAPDDDPTFLRQLDDEAWRRRARERREGEQSGPADV